ncbi:Sec-independent protein translocase protein TatB [Gymnodinialimonas hymeniacidonis]|uniref:Sec-independent protein translocase protein TatB n=1 Tax=Gymnodinialimonas hymeniacidonis TaxID=3126508 RepID=UPI0034C654AB
MPDIGMMEMLVIGIVALIVVGPKDLPKMFRKLGQMTGRVRSMAKEFSNAMNDAADETGMSQMNRDLKAAAKFTNPKAMAKDMMGDVMDDIDPSKFEEGSATRAIAEKKAAAQAETRERIAAMKAERAAETSDEPEEASADATPEEPTFVADADAPEGPVKVIQPADPGPANVEPERS